MRSTTRRPPPEPYSKVATTGAWSLVPTSASTRHEAARSIEDVLARRTRALFLDARASIEAAPLVAGLLASVLGRDPAWQDAQVARFRELAVGYVAPAGR